MTYREDRTNVGIEVENFTEGDNWGGVASYSTRWGAGLTIRYHAVGFLAMKLTHLTAPKSAQSHSFKALRMPSACTAHHAVFNHAHSIVSSGRAVPDLWNSSKPARRSTNSGLGMSEPSASIAWRAAGMTSRPMPSAGTRPILRDERAAAAVLSARRRGIRDAIGESKESRTRLVFRGCDSRQSHLMGMLYVGWVRTKARWPSGLRR